MIHWWLIKWRGKILKSFHFPVYSLFKMDIIKIGFQILVMVLIIEIWRYFKLYDLITFKLYIDSRREINIISQNIKFDWNNSFNVTNVFFNPKNLVTKSLTLPPTCNWITNSRNPFFCKILNFYLNFLDFSAKFKKLNFSVAFLWIF